MTERIPPGQHIIKKLAVFTVEPIPHFDGQNWDITIKGEVENPITLSFEEFNKLKKDKVVIDFHCVTTWSLLDTVWEGVLFKTIIDIVKPLETAKYVFVQAKSFYSTNFKIEDIFADNVILATHYNGKPLEPKHGYPIRLVVPHLYAYKSLKYVSEIEFRSEEMGERLGYWEKRGYSNSADPWKEERYSDKNNPPI